MKIYDQALIRIPQLPLNASITDYWEDLKASIKVSSSDFYEQIRHVHADDLDTLPRSIYHTVWKYFNRAKYRATPYGTFAGCGLAHFSEGGTGNRIKIENTQTIHTFPCWTLTEGINSEQETINKDSIVFANHTYYQVGNSLRFIAREDNTFILAETEYQPELIKILSAAKTPAPVAELMADVPQCRLQDVQEMVNLQLLLPANTPNIIGEDYFKRTGYTSRKNDAQYILPERTVLDSALSQETFAELSELIKIMQHLVPDPPAPDLDKFKSAFTRKFEDRAIPLMVALDPEIGIGYGHLDTAAGMESPMAEPVELPYSDKRALIEMLYRSMVATGCKVIQLDQLPASASTGHLEIPGSLGVLCSVVDDLLIIEQIASPTANRLLGRFSMINQDLANLCQNVASEEAKSNPEVSFFDIGYTDEIAVDNVNRRKSIYPYQVSLLNFDGADGALNLSDIDVTVSNGNVILYHRELKKRLIPRLASGYNYKRSNLAVYRFLNDLQYDGLKINFNLKLSDSFPDEAYYPRVQYKQIVMSPAQWRISADTLKSHARGAVTTSSLRSYLRSLGMDRFAVTRTEDRTMVFDLDAEADLNELLHVLSKFSSFILEEGFIPKTPIVEDKTGNPYIHQVIVSLLNEKPIYTRHPMPQPAANTTIPVKAIFPPAQEWLYFEIYAHAMRIDEILTGPVQNLLSELKDKIKTWFFVRYDNNGSHLRLRINPRRRMDHPFIINALNAALQEGVTTGIISDLKISTYKREIERYGADLISSVEAHYGLDSQYVISLLQHQADDHHKYFNCMDMIMYMLKALDEKSMDGIAYIDQVCEAFQQEYQLKGEAFKDLNKMYRQVSASDAAEQERIFPLYNQFKTSAFRLLELCPPDRKLKLMADLLHMHVNRLFPAHQRTHEMMVYYFTKKMLLREKALEKQEMQNIT